MFKIQLKITFFMRLTARSDPGRPFTRAISKHAFHCNVVCMFVQCRNGGYFCIVSY